MSSDGFMKDSVDPLKKAKEDITAFKSFYSLKSSDEDGIRKMSDSAHGKCCTSFLSTFRGYPILLSVLLLPPAIASQLKTIRQFSHSDPKLVKDCSAILSSFLKDYSDLLSKNERELKVHLGEIYRPYGHVKLTVMGESSVTHYSTKRDRTTGEESSYSIEITPITSLHDSVAEARWYSIVSKDGNSVMMPFYEAYALGHIYICVTSTWTLDTLRDYLATPASSVEKTKLKSIFSDILHGVAYLHNELRVAHMDLNPQSIFYDGSRVILRNFQCARPVANPEFTAVEEEVVTKIKDKLERTGVPAGEMDNRKQNEYNKLQARYENSNKKYRAIVEFLSKPATHIRGPLKTLPPLRVPLQVFFRPSYQKLGFTFDNIQSISGKKGPVHSQMSGNKLVESFLADLRREYPEENAQKRALTTFTATLKPNLPAKLYVAATPASDVLALDVHDSLGTLEYMCPALRSGKPANPFAADVYSLGVILFYMVLGFEPYDTYSEKGMQAFLGLKRSGVAYLLELYNRVDSIHPTCLALLEKMMNVDPENRPTIDECIKEFEGVNLTPA